MLSTRNFICSTNLSSVILWSRVDAASDQYAVPSLFITMYFAPLILYASLISWPMLSRSRSWGIFVYRVEKSKLSKCLAPLVLLTFLSFLRTSVALSDDVIHFYKHHYQHYNQHFSFFVNICDVIHFYKHHYQHYNQHFSFFVNICALLEVLFKQSERSIIMYFVNGTMI